MNQPSFPFCWREDPAANVAVFQYTQHIFGAKSSLTCAKCALQNTASVTAAENTGAAGSVQENSYMDDYPESNQTVEKAKQKTQDLPVCYFMLLLSRKCCEQCP